MPISAGCNFTGISFPVLPAFSSVRNHVLSESCHQCTSLQAWMSSGHTTHSVSRMQKDVSCDFAKLFAALVPYEESRKSGLCGLTDERRSMKAHNNNVPILQAEIDGSRSSTRIFVAQYHQESNRGPYAGMFLASNSKMIRRVNTGLLTTKTASAPACFTRSKISGNIS